jgi:predicted alpha/beta-fold hydrolase
MVFPRLQAVRRCWSRTARARAGQSPRRPSTATAGRPLAILIHGLTGDEDGAYMHATATALLAAGLPVLRLNLRGAGASRPLCRGTYHAGRSEDLRAVVARLPSDLARDGVVLVGYSLGANMVLKFLGERDCAVPVRAAAAISSISPRNGWTLSKRN